jgi:hypothetical protein
MSETITLTYVGGLKITIIISITGKFDEKLEIVGEKGSIRCAAYHMAGKALLENEAGKLVYKGNGGYDNEFMLAAGEILNGQTESDYVPRESTLAVLGMMDECRRQMGLVYPFEA